VAAAYGEIEWSRDRDPESFRQADEMSDSWPNAAYSTL